MSLKILFKLKHDGITWKSGYFYSFKYTAFEEDPNPYVVILYGIKGNHPTTGHRWNLIQGINVNYLPRKDRKEFVKIWRKNIENGKTPQFTWEMVKKRFPYMKFAIRRYLLSPSYYIRQSKEIPYELLDKEIIRSWHKDFSKTLKRKIGAKLKGFFVGKRK